HAACTTVIYTLSLHDALPICDRQFTEQDIIGPTDFLSHIVNEWEQEAMKSGIRTVLMRLGVVLGAGEGAFPKMLLPYRLFVGGRDRKSTRLNSSHVKISYAVF